VIGTRLTTCWEPCGAPPFSSHLELLFRPELGGGLVVQGLVRSVLVVEVDPPTDGAPCVVEAAKVVLPRALFFEAFEEALDQAILLGGVGSDELLGQPVVSTGGPEASALENQPVVGADHGRFPRRPQGPEAPQTGFLQGALRFFGPTAQRELVADDLAIVAVDHRRQVCPTVSPTRDVGDVHRPTLVAGIGLASPATRPRPGCGLPLVDEPPLDLQDAIHGLPVDFPAVSEAQPRPQAPVPKRRKRWINSRIRSARRALTERLRRDVGFTLVSRRERDTSGLTAPAPLSLEDAETMCSLRIARRLEHR